MLRDHHGLHMENIREGANEGSRETGAEVQVRGRCLGLG